MATFEKQKITFIGAPRQVKTSKGFSNTISIKTDRLGDTYISGWENAITKQWKVGDEITISVSTRESNGKTYHNFELPKTVDIKDPDAIKLSMISIHQKLDAIYAILKKNQEPAPEELADIPFDGPEESL